MLTTPLPSSAQNVNGLSITGPAPWIDVTAYGAKADSQVTTNCSTNATGKQLTCTSATFLGTDIGKAISVYGGGAGGTDLFTTIQGVNSSTVVTLSASAVANLTGLTVRWSTDNTLPIQSAINAVRSNGGTVYFPYGGTGNYYVSVGPISGESLAVGVNPLSLPSPTTNIVPGIKLIGECAEPGDPGTPKTIPSNCTAFVTDQAVVILTVGDTLLSEGGGPKKLHGLTIEDLGFKDVSFPDATGAINTSVTGGIRLLNTEDFNLTNLRIQRITNGYGILFEGGSTGSSVPFTQFGIVVNPSIANTKFPIQTKTRTSEVNFYGGNVGCQNLPGTSQIAGSIGMDLGVTNFATGVVAAGEWGVFGTHILDCATGVSMKNSNVLQWYGIAEQTIGTPKVGTGFVIDSESGQGGANLIGGSLNNFDTAVQLKGFAFDTIVTGSITNNSVGLDLAGTNVTRTKVLGTLSPSNTTQLKNTSGAPGPLSTALLLTDVTFSAPKAKPGTNPASGRRLYSDSGSNNDLTVLRPDGTTTEGSGSQSEHLRRRHSRCWY